MVTVWPCQIFEACGWQPWPWLSSLKVFIWSFALDLEHTFLFLYIATDADTVPFLPWSWNVILERTSLYIISLEGRLCSEQWCRTCFWNKRLNLYSRLFLAGVVCCLGFLSCVWKYWFLLSEKAVCCCCCFGVFLVGFGRLCCKSLFQDKSKICQNI